MGDNSVSKDRKAKVIYRPWTVNRIFAASREELHRREWQLNKLLHAVQNELHTVRNQQQVREFKFKETGDVQRP